MTWESHSTDQAGYEHSPPFELVTSVNTSSTRPAMPSYHIDGVLVEFPYEASEPHIVEIGWRVASQSSRVRCLPSRPSTIFEVNLWVWVITTYDSYTLAYYAYCRPSQPIPWNSMWVMCSQTPAMDTLQKSMGTCERAKIRVTDESMTHFTKMESVFGSGAKQNSVELTNVNCVDVFWIAKWGMSPKTFVPAEQIVYWIAMYCMYGTDIWRSSSFQLWFHLLYWKQLVSMKTLPGLFEYPLLYPHATLW